MKYLLAVIVFFNAAQVLGQDTTLRIGRTEIARTGTNYYNHSDPDKVNFEVILWGGIKNPGKYLIPQGTTLIDLITLSGGPNKAYVLRNIKLIQVRDSGNELVSSGVLNLNYEDFFNYEKRSSYKKMNPVLSPGDIIVLPIEDDKTFWDYFKEILSYLSPILSIISIVVLIATRLNN